MTPKIKVSLRVYQETPVPLASGGTYNKRQMAFFVEFPNGTVAWSHSRANFRMLAREYSRAANQVHAIELDDSCGNYDP